LQPPDRILEVGCGTGAIASELHNSTGASLFGVDQDHAGLNFAHELFPEFHWIQSLGDALPFMDRTFGGVYCHFYLMWVNDPLSALREMVRVVQPGGVVFAFAEPDYSQSRVFPPSLHKLKAYQIQSLLLQAANPNIGSHLREFFKLAGLTEIESGALKSEPAVKISRNEWEAEWQVLRTDLNRLFPDQDLKDFHQIFQTAFETPGFLWSTPVWFAAGKAP
jgi:ubiquinone/menaquinone biosynthesis C-methylase UbiE